MHEKYSHQYSNEGYWLVFVSIMGICDKHGCCTFLLPILLECGRAQAFVETENPWLGRKVLRAPGARLECAKCASGSFISVSSFAESAARSRSCSSSA
jgi:hypothetical protein